MSADQAFDAVFLDLDDTLLDTSGQLIGPAHCEAAEAMVAAGLDASVDEVLAARVTFARTFPGEDVDKGVSRALPCADPEAVAEAGRSAFFRREIGPLEVSPALAPILEALRQSHRLFLVTAGDADTQRSKVEALGIEDHFEGLRFVPLGTEAKAVAFAELVDVASLDPSRCVVVGDRVDREIQAGRGLGMWAVWVRNGEGGRIVPTQPAQEPHAVIRSIDQLPAALEWLATQPYAPPDDPA